MVVGDLSGSGASFKFIAWGDTEITNGIVDSGAVAHIIMELLGYSFVEFGTIGKITCDNVVITEPAIAVIGGSSDDAGVPLSGSDMLVGATPTISSTIPSVGYIVSGASTV